MEGGAVQHDNIAVKTMDNVTGLRRSISRLIAGKLSNKDLDVDVELCGGIAATISKFKSQPTENSDPYFLLIDADVPPADIPLRLKNQELEAYKEIVFFMVQEMEAWILSQPDNIEVCYKNCIFTANNPIAEGVELKDKDVHLIPKPSKLLKTILQRYFSEVRKGETKKKKYASKLVDGSKLLSHLCIHRLYDYFPEVKRLVDTLNAIP